MIRGDDKRCVDCDEIIAGYYNECIYCDGELEPTYLNQEKLYEGTQ